MSSTQLSCKYANTNDIILSQFVPHSSEIRTLCLMKWLGEMLQNLPYFIYENPKLLFPIFSSCHFILEDLEAGIALYRPKNCDFQTSPRLLLMMLVLQKMPTWCHNITTNYSFPAKKITMWGQTDYLSMSLHVYRVLSWACLSLKNVWAWCRPLFLSTPGESRRKNAFFEGLPWNDRGAMVAPT